MMKVRSTNLTRRISSSLPNNSKSLLNQRRPLQSIQLLPDIGSSCHGRRIHPTKRVISASATPDVPEVDRIVDNTINIVKFAGDLLKQSIDLIIKAEKVALKAVPVVIDTAQRVAPIVKTASKTAEDVSDAALSAAIPFIKTAVQAISNALSDTGVDVEGVQSNTETAVKTATDVASPVVKSSVNFLTTTNPTTLGYYALTAAAIYFFGPALVSTIIGSTRGYEGDISAAGVLDIIMANRNAFIVDIRKPAEKEKSGILDVPGNLTGQLIEVEFATTTNQKLRKQLGNPNDVETKITALQITALRRLSSSSQIFVLDANGTVSKRVAKELGRLRYGRAFVVNDGYSGWIRSKLQTKPSPRVFNAEVVPPITSVIGTVFGGTTQRQVPVSDKKALPPGK